MWLWARLRVERVVCAGCGQNSARVHSRYERRVADAALAGRRVVICLRVRRFVCRTQDCRVKTFVEQVEGLTERYGRPTVLLREMVIVIGVALAGRAGSRLAAGLGLSAGRNVLLCLVGGLLDPEVGVVVVLGVDDFALRRNRRYGTVLIDMDTPRPVDVLADRKADTFADWWGEHPGTEVICRDRAGAYAEAAERGAPRAVQVADRWHLWHSLGEQVEKTVAAHHGCLRERESQQQTPPETPASASAAAADVAETVDLVAVAEAVHATGRANSGLVARSTARFEQVQALKAQGKGIKPSMRELGLAQETVRKFSRAASVEEVTATSRAGRPSVPDEFKPSLHERFNAEITNLSAFFQEIGEQGYRGSRGTVADYLAPLRAVGAAPAPKPAAPKVRHVASWMLHHPEDLDEDQHLQLTQVRTACSHLDATANHVTEFAKILTNQGGERLNEWMNTVEADELPPLHRFVHGLRHDYDAVLNGLTLPHNSGAVKSNINHIKMIKRQMYGRANFDLLRKRILHPT
ncbi:MAG: ISL3 family transposase [Pseudonocardiaceae bacterium]